MCILCSVGANIYFTSHSVTFCVAIERLRTKVKQVTKRAETDHTILGQMHLPYYCVMCGQSLRAFCNNACKLCHLPYFLCGAFQLFLANLNINFHKSEIRAYFDIGQNQN